MVPGEGGRMKRDGKWLRVAAATGAVAAIALATAQGQAGGKVQPAYGAGAAADWTSHGGAADETGYSRLDQINRRTAGRLGLAWSLELPGEVTLQATPLAVGGILYFTGTYSAVYAVNGATGKLLWRYDPEIWKHDPGKMRLNFAANRGVAYAAGRLFVATLDGRMIALNARTGKMLWSAKAIDDGAPYYSTGAPRVMGDKVIIGQGGGDFGSRGYVTAFDVATGKQAWRFYTVPGSPEQNRGDPVQEMAARTWTGEWWKTGTGGGPWNSMVFDPELNRIYIGTGNSGPYDPAKRSPGGGDNLFLVSIVALDANTGKYIWHYQQNPREAWDYKATATISAATLTIDGQPRKVLIQAPVNGFFYVIDRLTGKLLSAEKYTKVNWAERIDLSTGRPVENANIRYENGAFTIWPSSVGGHNWQAMAFSPQTGLAYFPTIQGGLEFDKGPVKPGQLSLGGLSINWNMSDPDDGAAWLQAWDPVRQKLAWKVKQETFWNGGALATAGGLVFQGTANGWLNAYDATSGERLWRAYVNQGIQAAPMSYAAGGVQYVAILAGWGGSASLGGEMMNHGWKYGVQPRRLLAYRVDGKAVLPPSPGPDKAIVPLDDPALVLKPEDVEAGRQMFIQCALCHGRDAISRGTAPDLRESPVALDFDAMWNVVHDGALMARGMPRYEFIPREDLRKIHAYVRERARAAKNGEAPAAQGTPSGRM